MIYIFDYMLNNDLKHHVCYSIREAEIFFDILISAGAFSIRVITKKVHNRKCGLYDKI